MPRRSKTDRTADKRTVEELRARVQELNAEYPGENFDDAARDEWNDLNERIDELETRRARVLELARAGNGEGGFGGHSRTDNQPPDQLRSVALGANDRAAFLPERAREHMENMLRQDDDPNNGLAQYTVALANRSYYRAFAKWWNDPVSGGHEWTPDEREAVQKVRLLERSMVLGTDNVGGFLALPYELDPNILITASYKDPMREICRVETGVLNAKRFITSAGSTSSWDAEEVEVSDDSPTLAAVTITAKKAMTFIPVSFELYEDTSIAQQVGALFADSKANLESLSFTLTQSGGPVGLVSAVIAGGTVQATATNAYAASDVYTNAAALPARWRSNASWMANGAVVNAYRQLPVGTNVQQSLVDSSTTPPKLLDWPIYENSNMDGVLNGSAADYVLMSGDYKQYVIYDRLPARIELIPNLMKGSFRPSGQRGFLQHWRVGGDALVPTAFVLTNLSA